MSRGGINRVTLIGHLGSDPELRTVSDGIALATVNLATTEYWTNKEGQSQSRTEWHRLVLWRQLAALAQQYLTKGSKIYVEGKLQTRVWEDQNQQKRHTTEVVVDDFQMLDSKSHREDAGAFGLVPTDGKSRPDPPKE